MTKVTSKALGQSIEIGRVIDKYTIGKRGPGVIITAGIHGNETSGVFALVRVFNRLREEKIAIRGEVTGLAGNLKALRRNVRYIDCDLNRIWSASRINKISTNGTGCKAEEIEMRELIKKIDEACHDAPTTVKFFLDCHTTSSESQPYISAHDFPHSFNYSFSFPVSTVLGLGKSIPGTIDDYLNSKGFLGFTFEAGQHDDLSSIENQEAMIWMTLINTGCVDQEDVANYAHFEEILKKSITEGKKAFKLKYRYNIREGEGFKMKPGFVNFQKIKKGEILAENNKGEIRSEWNGRILMPLYQKQGNDGFFVVQETKRAKDNIEVKLKS